MIDNIAFDRIITHKDADKHIVANTYLHILSAHRYFIKRIIYLKKISFGCLLEINWHLILNEKLHNENIT